MINTENESLVTVDQLVEDFEYLPDTGELLHARDKGRGGSRVFAGDEAGSISAKGYRVVRINKIIFFAHRVCWAIHHGEWPAGEIDHKNQVKTDNRMANLRIASPSENRRNSPPRRDNKTGVMGVTAYRDRFRVQIVVDGKNRRLGTYRRLSDAAMVRRVAEACLWGGLHTFPQDLDSGIESPY